MAAAGGKGRFDEIEQSARAAINPLTDDGGARYAAFWDWLGATCPASPAGSSTWSPSHRQRRGKG